MAGNKDNHKKVSRELRSLSEEQKLVAITPQDCSDPFQFRSRCGKKVSMGFIERLPQSADISRSRWENLLSTGILGKVHFSDISNCHRSKLSKLFTLFFLIVKLFPYPFLS